MVDKWSGDVSSEMGDVLEQLAATTTTHTARAAPYVKDLITPAVKQLRASAFAAEDSDEQRKRPDPANPEASVLLSRIGRGVRIAADNYLEAAALAKHPAKQHRDISFEEAEAIRRQHEQKRDVALKTLQEAAKEAVSARDTTAATLQGSKEVLAAFNHLGYCAQSFESAIEMQQRKVATTAR